MLEIRAARDRAVRRAIRTGEMPNLDLIHTIQRSEGCHPCFGRTDGICRETVCRWHRQCMALVEFEPHAASPAAGRPPMPFQPLRRRDGGTYRDGRPGPAGGDEHSNDPVPAPGHAWSAVGVHVRTAAPKSVSG